MFEIRDSDWLCDKVASITTLDVLLLSTVVSERLRKGAPFSGPSKFDLQNYFIVFCLCVYLFIFIRLLLVTT